MEWSGKRALFLGAGAAGIAAAAGLAALRDGGPPVVTVALDRSITTSEGRVTAHGWSPSAGRGLASEADVESCQVEPDGTVIALQRFRLALDEGPELEPAGSRLSVTRGAGCLRAIVLFVVPSGASPTAVLFRADERTVRWPLAPQAVPAASP